MLIAVSVPSLAQKPAKGAAQGKGIQQGKKIYVANCVSCHGPDGTANTGMGRGLGVPPLSKNVPSMKEADLKTIIVNGKGAMPAWKATLKDAEIAQVAAYVKSLARQKQ